MVFVSLLLTSLLSAGPSGPPLSELGGRVHDSASSTAPLFPHAVEVRLYSDTACVASTTPDEQGVWLLRAPAGDYWVSVSVGGREVDVRRVTLSDASRTVDLQTHPGLERLARLVPRPGRAGPVDMNRPVVTKN